MRVHSLGLIAFVGATALAHAAAAQDAPIGGFTGMAPPIALARSDRQDKPAPERWRASAASRGSDRASESVSSVSPGRERFGLAGAPARDRRSPHFVPSGGATSGAPRVYAADGTYLGKLARNGHDSESVANRTGKYGSPHGNTVTNPAGRYGSPYSSTSATNPYATKVPRIYAKDGTYLGKLSSNEFDSESTSNPYGRYGSPYGNTVNNPYSPVGRSVAEPSSSARSAPEPAARPSAGPVEEPLPYVRPVTPGSVMRPNTQAPARERSTPSYQFTPYRAPSTIRAPVPSGSGFSSPTFFKPLTPRK